ncbi:hypothetical protein AZ032_004930, partial [Klebsiella pneumoniae]
CRRTSPSAWGRSSVRCCAST